MVVLSGADLVLPHGIRSSGTLVVEGDRIVDASASGALAAGASDAEHIDVSGHIIVPGFIDVHVHGLEGIDTLDGARAIEKMSRELPKYGVTAFCPTTVACDAQALRDVLSQVAALRPTVGVSAARVLPAHLESNFVHPDYRGAQPVASLRNPADGADIVAEIDRAGGDVGIVTLAPELEGALGLIRHLVSQGRRVSLGHSGATLEQARTAIAAGARHATHLFNRMPPLNHREPGLAGAILTSEQVAAEIICDGVHVHRDMVRMAIAAKGTARMMAITDSVALAGLHDGACALLGGRRIRVDKSAAYLDDGTLAGSIATMDRVFRFLVRDVGLSLNDAAQLSARTPASELGLSGLGELVRGALADFVVMDREFRVMRTYIAGRLVYARH